MEMHTGKYFARVSSALLIFAGVISLSIGAGQRVAGQQPAPPELQKKFHKQYAAIQKKFADGPEMGRYPRIRDEAAQRRMELDRREKVGKWQDELAAKFAAAAATAEEIVKLNPPDVAKWKEHRDTLGLYSQPISSPDTRTVFGQGEVQKPARLFKQPLAVYPDEARNANTKDEVRLRLVLAADGTVKHIFPVKAAKHGLTEAAMEAARRIEFEPAIRNGRRASQFISLVYKFEDGRSLPAFVPTSAF
jgi:TonB family protein